jgi:hypothetical protein
MNQADQQPNATPAARPAYDWWLGACLSWVVALLAGAIALLLLTLNADPRVWWFLWGVVAVLLAMGFVLSLLPSTVPSAREWVRNVASAGFVWTILATLWSAVMFIAVLPPVQAQVKVWNEQAKRAAAKEAEHRRLEREQANRARRDTVDRANEQRDLRIKERDDELRRRSQEGEDGSPLPVIPSKVPESIGATIALPPLMSPQPLRVRAINLLPQSRQRDLAGQAKSVRDLRLQPLALSSIELVHNALWLDDSHLLLLTLAGKLLEIDTSEGKLVRELELGGPCVSLTQSKLGIVIARSDPGALVLVDPESLIATTEIPLSPPLEAAAHPQHNLVFVRIQIGPYSLAAVNLESRTLQHLVTPEDCVRLGHERNLQWAPESPPSIDALSAASRTQLLARGGTRLYRWSLRDENSNFSERLYFEESAPLGGHEFIASSNGSLVLTPTSLLAVNELQSPRARLDGEYRTSTAAIAGGSGLIFAADGNAKLQVFSPEGNHLMEYPWPDGAADDKIQSVHISPSEKRLLVMSQKELCLAGVPSGLSDRFPRKLLVSQASWPPLKKLPKLRIVDMPPQGKPRPGLPSRKLIDGVGFWCWSADSMQLFRLHDGLLSRVNARTLKVERAVSVPADANVSALRVSQAGLVAIDERPSRLWVVDPQSLVVARVIEAPELMTYAFDPPNVSDRHVLMAATIASPLTVELTHNDHLLAIDLRTGHVAADVPLAAALGRPDSSFDGQGEFAQLEFTPDGRQLFVARGGLHRFSVGPSGLEYQESAPSEPRTTYFCLSADGHIVAARAPHSSSLWFDSQDLTSPLVGEAQSLTIEPGRTALDHDGQCMWTADFVYNHKRKVGFDCQLPEGTVSQLRLSPDGRWLLAVCRKHAYLVETRLAMEAIASLPDE